MKLNKVFFGVLMTGIIGCQKNVSTIIENPHFSMTILSPEQSGIHFKNTLKEQPDLNIIEYLYYYNGGGVAVGDLNNDGLEDLYFSANQLPDRLYLNEGNLKFKDISSAAGIDQTESWSTGVSMQDVNNDGYLDIYVCKVGAFNSLKAQNQLYINNGDLTFTESAEKLGVAFSGFSTQAAFLDYDKDGDLDFYLLNHNIHSVRSYGTVKNRTDQDPLAGDRFYENQINENGRFVDKTKSSQIYSSPLGYGLAIGVSDFNHDGWPDLYVGNDFHENDYLYLNNKDGSFTESIKASMNHTSRFTMGIDIADLNNDGNLDVFTTDMLPFDPAVLLKSGGEDSDKVARIKANYGFNSQFARNHLQLNRGNHTYADVALMTQTYATDWSWGVLLADFDNDGWNDIFIPNGIVKRPNDLDYINYLSNTNFSAFENSKKEQLRKRIIEEMPTLKIPNLLIKNKGDLDFEAVENSAIGSPSYTTGAAYSDLDNDGDLDLIFNNVNASAQILKNNSLSNNTVQLQLVPTKDYPQLLGTRIHYFAGGKRFVREYQSLRGFQSTSSHKINITVPQGEKLDSIQVFWPHGTNSIVTSVQEGAHLNLSPTDTIRNSTINQPENRFVLKNFPFRHIENTYYDEDKETLIPERLSQEGPATAYEDFNQDGIKDFFIGGGREQPAQVLFGTTKGEFYTKFISDFERDRGFEDVAVSTLDIDRDGDLDLFIGSGGNQEVSPNPSLEDRIYVNDGRGVFKRAPIQLPQTYTGTVAIADFDNDGFPDYFIGSRNITGAYGLTPNSFIVQNKDGLEMKMLDRKQWGMISDAQWVDLNGDDFLDLVLVGDWMPITVLINNQGKSFENKTLDYGLANTSGLWNTVEIHDFDDNGLPDIIAGNSGVNSKWHPTKERPVKLYLDDFDENQQADPIIFYPFGEREIPFAGKDKLASQLPMVKKRFTKYHDFAKVSDIKSLLGKSEENILQIKQLNELRSMVFLNQEGKSFSSHPLPDIAQQSTIEGISINDSNGTIAFVGNSKTWVVELGNNLANPGGILKGFDPMSGQYESFEPFPLPIGTVGKHIYQLPTGDYIIIVNDGDSYQISAK
jgi:hypothetical protein